MKNPDELLKDFLKSDKSIDVIISESTPKQEKKMEDDLKYDESKIEMGIEKVKFESLTDLNRPFTETENKIIEEIKNNPIRFDNKDNLILKELTDIKSDIEVLKEAIVEILNRSIQNNTLFTEKLKTIQSNPNPIKKRVLFNRDETGKIIGADLLEEKIES
jgi:hypothetical protein